MKNLGKIKSKCDKKNLQKILQKYDKYSEKDMPFEVGKAILKEVNKENEPTTASSSLRLPVGDKRALRGKKLRSEGWLKLRA